MKNDYEYIKDKIENSGVDAPDTMGEDFVLNKLEGIAPEPVPQLVEVKPHKRRTGMIAGIAAAFVAVATLSVLGVVFFSQQHRPEPAPGGVSIPAVSADIPLKTFQSYDEVKAYAAELEKNQPRYSSDLKAEEYAEDGVMNGEGSSGSSKEMTAGGGESHSETYKQVEGVDEADVVKTDGKYLYIVSGGDSDCVCIYSATDDPAQIASIYPGNPKAPTAVPASSDEDGSAVFATEMFLYNDRLIVCCQNRDANYDYSTCAMVYDISDINNIRLVDRLNQSGSYGSSRMIGDRLYMISEQTVYTNDFHTPVCYRGDKEDEIPVESVYAVRNSYDNAMLIVGGYDLSDDAKEVETSAIMGSLNDVYCSEENLYIYSSKQRFDVVEDGDSMLKSRLNEQKYEAITTDIYKVSLEDGIDFTGFGTVEGYIDSRYSLDERDGFLRVAATTEDNDHNDVNALYILDENLRQVGSVTGIAKGESIKAVRYVGDTAYVITYEQTDPLFVIDLGDPENPTVLGEVKIDGFSTMLVPIDDDTVLGLGVYTTEYDNISMQVQDGFKLALFDVSDRLHPKVLDERSYPKYFSDVMYDPRALIYNPDRGDYLVPLNTEAGLVTDKDGFEDIGYRGGALNFKVQDGRIVEIDRPTAKGSVAVARCLYVGDNIYMIGYNSESVGVYTAKYK